MAAAGKPLDEDLQSRQMAVYGRESMMKLSTAKVLISGLNGLGAEAAKNVILANVKSVTLHDTEAAKLVDLGANFYLSKEDVGKNRAEACKAQFQELNPNVDVQVLTAPLTAENIKGFNVIVLCDSTLEKAQELNTAARALSPPAHFIYGKLNGVFGSVFCDFGDNFVCLDTTGEAVKTAIVHSIQKSKAGEKALVQCVMDEAIDLDDDEHVVFTEVKGMTQLNDGKPRKISDVSKGKKNFKIEDTSAFGDYTSGGIVTQKKIPLTLNFKPLSQTLTQPGKMSDIDTSKQTPKACAFDESVLEFLGQDAFETKFGNSGFLHLAHQAIEKIGTGAAVGAGGVDKLKAAINEINATFTDKVEELDCREKAIASLARGAGAILSPMAAIFGGIIGQEVIKAATSKFHPTFQWFHYDCIECLPDEAPPAAETDKSRYGHQLQVFGEEMHKKITDLNIFLVGSGALGCEFLKSLALMGVSSAGGNVTVTDDDVIEKSNLSRQFLFRNHNIGHSKSESASKAAKVMNPDFKAKALTERVQQQTENIFDDDFWTGTDLVVNALDNVKARLYVDSRCVLYGKPLLESGTLGPKCNTQAVIPGKTENYGATRDPPEKEAPQCALHNFPHNIDHCLGLAKSEFVGNFETLAADANEFSKGPQKFVDSLIAAGENPEAILDKLVGDPKFNCAMQGGLTDALITEPAQNFDQCIGWARRKFQSYFVDRINLLLYNCPADMKTSSGTPFWAPPKRLPKVIEFSVDDEMVLKFIIAASNLRAKLYGITEEHREKEYFVKVLKDVKIPEFKPFKTEVKTGEDEQQAEGEAPAEAPAAAPKDMEEDKARLEAALKSVSGGVVAGKEYFSNEFEKDHDDNFHIDFIQSFANLRARNYAIDEIDFLQAKLKAGRIIPAIATATAMATGFVCLEMYKVVGKKPAAAFRNTFSNLALPLYSQSEPAPPDSIVSGTRFDKEMYMDVDEVAVPDPQTTWDTITISAPRSITIKGLVDWFKAEKNLDLVGWIYTGADKKADSSPLEQRMNQTVIEYIESKGYPVTFPCLKKRKIVEIGDSPPDTKVLELKTADGDDVKICRVVISFTD
eukprot:TRINITY_DN480_c0_g1_i1.p1 TRINITY_DN480_c0_g1~~TRINITY_DN480_c0_g1_i1.p1  ORF type:complete len:1102 (+),score=325.79 TRINITY_DN480_c0_g1_i1:53-3307(+)